MLQDPENLIAPEPAAKLLRVELRTFLDRSWRRRHHIHAVRLGRRVIGITAEDLRAVLEREQHDGGSP